MVYLLFGRFLHLPSLRLPYLHFLRLAIFLFLLFYEKYYVEKNL